MAEPSSASDSHASPPYHTVFIDTSLDTHIVMIVSDADTVADLKNKILLEHPLCFSSIGRIKIHALKVKRKGYFYHLSDAMFVKSAFHGVKGTWFLYVDASSLVERSENQLACNPESGNLLLCLPSADGINLQLDESSKKLSVLGGLSLPKNEVNQFANEKVLSAEEFCSGNPVIEHLKALEMEVKHNSDDDHKTSLVSNRKLDPEENHSLYSGEIELAGTHVKLNKDDNKIDDMQCDVPLEEALKTEPVPKKKRKVKNKQKEALADRAPKEDNVLPVQASGNDTSQKESIIPENPVGNAGIEVPNNMKTGDKQVSDDPGEKSSSETSKRSDYGAQKKHDLFEEVQVQGTLVECQDIKLKDTIDVQCNSSLGGISQPKPAAKKKRKIAKKNEPKSLLKENEALLCDFNKETSEAKIESSENTLENKQKSINSNVDGLPIEPPEPNCLIGTSSSTGKRKRKKKSSNPCSLAVSEIPSEKDARQESSKATVEVNLEDSGREFDTVVVPGERIQDASQSTPWALSLKEEKSSVPVQVVEIPSLQPGIDMNEADACNAGRKSDAYEVGAGYEVKRRKGSKKHQAVDERDLSVKKANSLGKDLKLSEQENVAPGDHLEIEIDQTDKIEGEREISPNNDPNGMLSEKCRLSRCDGSNMSMKEVIVSSMILDANAGVEHQKPAVKRRKSKKAKNTVEETPVRSDMEHAKDPLNGYASTEPHKSFDGNHSSNEADKGETILSQTERTDILKIKATNTSPLGVDREIDVMSGNERESSHLAYISKTQEKIGDMVDDKVRKKTKKQSSTAKNLPDLQKKEQDVGPEISTSSTCKIKVDSPLVKRKTKSMKTSSTNQFKKSKLESEKDAGTEVESLHPKQDTGTFDSSRIPSSYEPENHSVGRLPEANVNGNLLKLGCINKANDHKEVSSYQGDVINMSRQSEHEVVAPTQVLADQDAKVKRSERVSKTNKNKKASSVHSVGTSCDLQNSSKIIKNQDVETKLEGDDRQQDPFSMDGHSKLMPESGRKFAEISRNDLKSPSHDIGKFGTIPEEVRWSNVANASGTNSTTHVLLKENGEASLSTSSSDSSGDRAYQNKRGKRQSNLDRYRVTVRKAPNKNTGEVVNSSDQRKSLLATYGSIFSDGDSESSNGDNGVVNSDASTRTPSNSSASSDYTEGENSQHLDSSHGLYSAKRDKSGAKSIRKSNSVGPKNVTIDAILRSSNRFKKAKLTASQSELNETESQPVDFVPDSQANS